MWLTSLRIRDFAILVLFEGVKSVAGIVYSVVVRFWLKHQMQFRITKLFLKHVACITCQF